MMIDNDHQFGVAVAALLKKNKKTCQVGVEFDVDEMNGYHIHTCVSFPYLHSQFLYFFTANSHLVLTMMVMMNSSVVPK